MFHAHHEKSVMLMRKWKLEQVEHVLLLIHFHCESNHRVLAPSIIHVACTLLRVLSVEVRVRFAMK